MKFASLLLVVLAASPLCSTAFAEPKDDLAAAVKAQNDAPAFRVKISTLDNSSKAATTMTMESVKPDQVHLKTEMGSMVVMEMYSDGTKTVMSQGGGAFQDAPPQMSALVGQMRQQTAVDTMLQAAKNIKLTGHESVNGTPTSVYTYDADVMGVQSANKFWVSDKDHRPVKSETEVHGSMNAGAATGQKVDMKVTAAFDYDPSIKVVMPAK